MALELSTILEETTFSVYGNGNCLLKVTAMLGYLLIEAMHANCAGFRKLCDKRSYDSFEYDLDFVIYSAWKEESLEELFKDGVFQQDDWMFRSVKRLHSQFEVAWDHLWRYSADKMDPTIASIKDAVFGATGAEIDIHPSVLEKPRLITDLLHNRAAAIAARYIVELSGMLNWDTWIEKWKAQYENPEEYDEHLCSIIESGYSGEVRQNSEAAVALLENWQNLFADDKKAYPELAATLNHLPAEISPELMCYLPQYHLGRVISDPLELAAVLNYARRHPMEFNGATLARISGGGHTFSEATWPAWCKGIHEKIGRLLESSSASDICKAMMVVAEYTGLDLNPDQDEAVGLFINFFDGYDGDVANDIRTFTRNVVAWKKEARNAAVKYHLTTDLELPTPALPNIPGIQFLQTMYDVDQAVSLFEIDLTESNINFSFGKYYCFLINHHQQAMVILNENYRIICAQGVDQRPNAATRWAEQVFTSQGWCTKVPEPLEIKDDDDEIIEVAWEDESITHPSGYGYLN
jgi:hypothetical protein